MMARRVLFLCIHNSARSQMAEAYLNAFSEGKFIAESAGLEGGKLNPFVVEVMREEGIDISGNETKTVSQFFDEGRRYDYVISVCDEANAARCPVFPGTHQRMNWNFDDPSAAKGSDEVKRNKTREVRDQIKEAVIEFIKRTSE